MDNAMRMRKGLDRKAELRLYEWMKGNYEQLMGKTANEGAALVTDELGMEVSSSTVVSMARAMELPPFWRARNKPQEPEPQEHENGHDLVARTVGKMQTTLIGHAKALMQQRGTILKLTEVCNNLADRVEALERQGHETKH